MDVLPYEAYGRVGGAGLRLLTELCEEARQWGPLRLGKPVGLNARSLRGTLEAALLRAQADVALLAVGSATCRALGWTQPTGEQRALVEARHVAASQRRSQRGQKRVHFGAGLAAGPLGQQHVPADEG